jgi:hypothetical protein
MPDRRGQRYAFNRPTGMRSSVVALTRADQRTHALMVSHRWRLAGARRQQAGMRSSPMPAIADNPGPPKGAHATADRPRSRARSSSSRQCHARRRVHKLGVSAPAASPTRRLTPVGGDADRRQGQEIWSRGDQAELVLTPGSLLQERAAVVVIATLLVLAGWPQDAVQSRLSSRSGGG